jgi:hypothetical protein
MYIGTGALFVRFLLDLVTGAAGVTATQFQKRVTQACRSCASLVVYGVSFSIVVGMFLMTAPGKSQTPAFPPTLWCVAVLTASYFAEFLTLEIAAAVYGNAAVTKARDEQMKGGVEAVPLKFPSMLCVLLVGMTLRMVQLSLQPPHWALVAMLLSTFTIIAQAALAVINVVCVAAKQEKTKQENEGVGGILAFASHLTLLFILCAGVATIIASLFYMEQDPVAALWPSTVDDDVRPDGGHALSTTMKCVMILTLLYFTVMLGLMVMAGSCAALRAWASSALTGVQNALVFAPMVCVMMIGVRLRAMQLKVQDPQPWAQTAMYTATYAILTQVLCSLLCQVFAGSPSAAKREEKAPAVRESGPDEAAGFGRGGTANFEAEEMALSSKAVVIVLLGLRYVASVVLFVSVPVLVVALFSMEPAMSVL